MSNFESQLFSINKRILLDEYEKTELTSLLDDLILLQKYISTNDEKYRFIDFVASVGEDFAYFLSSYAFELYNSKEFDLAAYAFLRVINVKNNEECSDLNNLVYMLRRNEGVLSTNFSFSDLVSLLKPGIENHSSFNIINLSLLFILNSGEGEDWKIANEVIQKLNKIDDFEMNSILQWWSDVEKVGTSECLVVHLLLIRNDIIKESVFGSKKEIIDKLSKENINIPEWI